MLLRLRPAAYGLICATFSACRLHPRLRTYRCDAANRRATSSITSSVRASSDGGTSERTRCGETPGIRDDHNEQIFSARPLEADSLVRPLHFSCGPRPCENRLEGPHRGPRWRVLRRRAFNSAGSTSWPPQSHPEASCHGRLIARPPYLTLASPPAIRLRPQSSSRASCCRRAH